MVSNAKEDLPEPDRPVITVSESRGTTTSTFLRLCSRAPRTWMLPALDWAMDRAVPLGWCLFRGCSRSATLQGQWEGPGPVGRVEWEGSSAYVVRIGRDG